MWSVHKRTFLKRIFSLAPFLFYGAILLSIVGIIRIVGFTWNIWNTYHFSPALFAHLVFPSDQYLKTQKERVNILILGIGGSTHEGFDLTDTMMVMSISLKERDIVLLPIPRDLWITTLKTKVNSVYHYGEQKKEGGGLILAKSTVSDIIGQPIHYGLVVDFSGFVKLIDTLGGITIFVERSFDDPLYPIPGKESDLCDGDPLTRCRYEHLSFTEGWQKMNGTTALKFVRSRNAQGREGTDLARGERQQQVIAAFQDAFFHSDVWYSPSKLYEMWHVAQEAVRTDFTPSEQLLLGRILFGLRDISPRRLELSVEDTVREENPNTLLFHPPREEYEGLWVLAPRGKTYDRIHAYIVCEIFEKNREESECLSSATEESK